MNDTEPEDQHPKEPLSAERRLDLLERDVRSHARSLTALVKSGTSFSNEQVEQLRTVLREEFGDVGIRMDGPDHVDDAREDFRFLRRMRRGVNGAASKVGWIVILAIVGIIALNFKDGISFWKGGA